MVNPSNVHISLFTIFLLAFCRKIGLNITFNATLSNDANDGHHGILWPTGQVEHWQTCCWSMWLKSRLASERRLILPLSSSQFSQFSIALFLPQNISLNIWAKTLSSLRSSSSYKQKTLSLPLSFVCEINYEINLKLSDGINCVL